ncbi:unnamed protein product [Rhodiola kirilowii]
MSSGEDLKSLLLEVGSKLGKPPSSVKELLPLLDRVEAYLARVEQSPSRAIQDALSPTLRALVDDKLLRHSDVDVRVSVASCISEVTRITAPEAPYDDEQMKEVFQLIVSSFESLPDMSSRSYSKRASILETVSIVRSSVVMLDLELDGLILEMFRHFITAIRDYHPEKVYGCMESIMTRVIEESEEIPSDLLFCILDTVKKDNKEVTPIACKLMKKVIETCADKLKPYIESAVRANVVSLAAYDEVVSLIFNEASVETVVQSESTAASVFEVVGADKPSHPEADPIQTADETSVVAVNAIEKLPADVVKSNGNAGVEAETLSGSSTLPDPKPSNAVKAPETLTAGPSAAVSNADGPVVETDTKASETVCENLQTNNGDCDAEELDEGESTAEPKTEKSMKKRGRKTRAKKKMSESKLAGKSSSTMNQLEVSGEFHKSSNKDMCPSPQQEPSIEAAEHCSLKPIETDDVPSKGNNGESGEILNGHSKSKTAASHSENHASLNEKIITPDTVDFKEETTILNVDPSDVKATVSAVDAPVDKTNAPNDENLENTTNLASDAAQEVGAPTVDEPVEEIETSAGKSPEQLGVPSEDTNKVEDGPSKTKDGIKKRGRGKGKATLHKLAAQATIDNNSKHVTPSQKSASKPVKDENESKDTPKTSSKRKRIEENNNESKDYGEELVGSKVKVYWPADKKFYKGVIEFFDSAKKKHKVLYADGEVEHLLLKKQRWMVVNSDEDSDSEEETDQKTADAGSEKRQKAKSHGGCDSKKRLGRPPSSNSKSASNKPGRKPKDFAKSGGKSRDDSKAGAKAKTDSSKEEEKSRVESIKKLGRPRADVSKSTDKSTAGEPSSKAAKKSKADESKLTDKSTAEDTKSSGKPKGNDSKTSIEGKSDSNAASKPEDENSSVKQKDPKGKGTKLGDETPEIKSAANLKSGEESENKSGSAAKEDTPKTASAAKRKGKSAKTVPKSDVKAPESADLDPSDEEDSKEVAEEQTPSLAKAAGSSKRKAPVIDKRNKSGVKSGQKQKKGRKN